MEQEIMHHILISMCRLILGMVQALFAHQITHVTLFWIIQTETLQQKAM